MSVYKKIVNGVVLEMTDEEISALNQAAQEQPEQMPEYVTYEALAQAIREGVNSIE